MALALNRYLCSAVLPLITKCAPLFAGSDHRAIMIDSMLHTIYRLSRGRAFTKAQRDIIEECLMALCKWVSLHGQVFLCHFKLSCNSIICLVDICVHPCFNTCWDVLYLMCLFSMSMLKCHWRYKCFTSKKTSLHYLLNIFHSFLLHLTAFDKSLWAVLEVLLPA